MNYSINCQGKLFDLSSPKVMGILNLTPDSFYEGSRNLDLKTAILKSEQMIEEGVDILDVGAMSTRPGIEELPLEEEKNRLIKPLQTLRKMFPQVLFSVDTYRAEIAEMAVDTGVDIVNDISGGDFDEKMFETVARLKVPYILMHTSDKPQFMQENTHYENILTDIHLGFGRKIKKLYSLGAKDIILDPGFGFGKTTDQNYFLLKNLAFFSELNSPILVGLSRKSMIYKCLETTPQDSLTGTIVLNTLALQNGASILRVHDVKEAKHTIELFSKIENTTFENL
ncbi:MAG: dihydropteroate synthase [Bacteroidales bacterium]|nr:dihydropteroate synthase [Bacteroidales bacterium]